MVNPCPPPDHMVCAREFRHSRFRPCHQAWPRSSIEATKRNPDNRHLRDSCSSRQTEQLQALEPGLAYTDWPVGTLLRHDADHCRAAVDHAEFARRGAANLDDT